MRTILGIDPSTKTGYAVIKNGEVIETGRIDTAPEEHILVRGTRIVNKLKSLIAIYEVDLISIEGYAMNGGFTIVQMVTIGAMIRTMIVSQGLEWWEISPKSLKKTTTGKGSATKRDMSMHVERKFGIKPKNNDIADAIALAMIAHRAYNLQTLSFTIGEIHPAGMLRDVPCAT